MTTALASPPKKNDAGSLACTTTREEVQNREEGEIGVKKVGRREKMKCWSREIWMRR